MKTILFAVACALFMTGVALAQSKSHLISGYNDVKGKITLYNGAGVKAGDPIEVGKLPKPPVGGLSVTDERGDGVLFKLDLPSGSVWIRRAQLKLLDTEKTSTECKVIAKLQDKSSQNFQQKTAGSRALNDCAD